MAIFRCSMFGHIVYDDKLTYQELLDTEARVTALMHTVLEECGAQHIDFTPQADALLVECLFPDVDRDVNHDLCDAVIRHLGPGVLARFLFVDRRMDSAVFYFLGRGKWQEQALSIPAPREALSGWVVRQERKPLHPRHVPATPPPPDETSPASPAPVDDGTPSSAAEAPATAGVKKRAGRKRTVGR